MITLRQHFSPDYKIEEQEEAELFASYNEEVSKALVDEFYGEREHFDYNKITFEQMAYIEMALSSSRSIADKYLEVLLWAHRGAMGFDFDSLTEYFNNITIGAVILLFDEVMDSRNSFFYEKFDGVIYEKPKEDEEKKEPKPPTREDLFYRKFGWYDKQKVLCREWNMPFKEILNETAEDCLTELAYLKYKAVIEDDRRRNEHQG
jgi:hypothetical protein